MSKSDLVPDRIREPYVQRQLREFHLCHSYTEGLAFRTGGEDTIVPSWDSTVSRQQRNNSVLGNSIIFSSLTFTPPAGRFIVLIPKNCRPRKESFQALLWKTSHARQASHCRLASGSKVQCHDRFWQILAEAIC